MTCSPSPSVDRQLSAHGELLLVSAGSESLLATLSSTLGTPFQLWDAIPGEPLSDHAAEANLRSDSGGDVVSAVESAHQHGCGKLALEVGTLGVWFRLPGAFGQPFLAFGTIPNRDPALIDLLMEAARRLIEQQVTLSDQSADLASCAEALSYGFEEQTWLRSLSNHLTLCSARRSLRDVASELLPSLRQLVGAESIAILLTKTTAAVEEGLAPSQDLIGQVLWAGPKIVDEQSWQTWLRDQPATPQRQPLVQNGARVNARLHRHFIQSFCAVQIIRGDEIYGWIVTANRSPRHWDVPGELPHRLSEVEFGTVEAGLIEAAAKMLATHGHNVELLHDRENLAIGVIRAMGNAVDARDPYTRGHSERVARYGRQLAKAIGLPQHECDRIYLSGLLHDVGKIGIPDAVLAKTGRLTEEEFAVVKRHPETGTRIVQTMAQLSDLLPGILHHHESFDGTGYPHGLAGDAIPRMGRILAVADAYDAMTSDRPYRSGMPRAKAVEILTSLAGIQWDDELVRAFLAIPEQALVLEAVEGDQGWNTDEDWLRSGAESMFEHRKSAGLVSEVLDDSLPNDLLAPDDYLVPL